MREKSAHACKGMTARLTVSTGRSRTRARYASVEGSRATPGAAYTVLDVFNTYQGRAGGNASALTREVRLLLLPIPSSPARDTTSALRRSSRPHCCTYSTRTHGAQGEPPRARSSGEARKHQMMSRSNPEFTQVGDLPLLALVHPYPFLNQCTHTFMRPYRSKTRQAAMGFRPRFRFSSSKV